MLPALIPQTQSLPGSPCVFHALNSKQFFLTRSQFLWFELLEAKNHHLFHEQLLKNKSAVSDLQKMPW